MADEKKIALFIDADNISAKYGKTIIETLQSRGEIIIRRIYGNWEKNSLHGWNECILNYGLLAVQQMDFSSGKNATDMSLTIDAMDVLYQRQATVFAIVSDDSDFTPLAVRLRERGVYVIGLGKKGHASVSFRNACNEFVEMEISEEEETKQQTSENLKTELEAVKVDSPSKKESATGENLKIEFEPIKAAPVSKVVAVPKTLPNVSSKKMTLEQRFAWCGQNGLKNPKKKFQQIHDVLNETVKTHADKNGFVPLNQAGQCLREKNLGFGVKDFGYSQLKEFIEDFPKLYEMTFNKNVGFLYSLKALRKSKKNIQLLHDVLRSSARAHADSDGFAPLTEAGKNLKEKNLGFGIKDFGYSQLNKFIGGFPDLYEIKKSENGKSFRYKLRK